MWRALLIYGSLLMWRTKLLSWYHRQRRHRGLLVQLVLLKQQDGLMLEGIPLLIRNGQCLLGVCLHIEDVADALLPVLVVGHGVHHRHDGLLHWCQGPGALLRTAGLG